MDGYRARGLHSSEEEDTSNEDDDDESRAEVAELVGGVPHQTIITKQQQLLLCVQLIGYCGCPDDDKGETPAGLPAWSQEIERERVSVAIMGKIKHSLSWH